jgi:hypothetical protein
VDTDERFLINARSSDFQNACFRALNISDERLVRVDKPVRVRAPKDSKKAIADDWKVDKSCVKRCLDGRFRKAGRAKRRSEELAAHVSAA